MKSVKIRNFNIDNALGYLIQNVTKDSTQEILAYFVGITQFVLDDINKSSKASFLDKNITLFYKETPITYKIKIQGSGPGLHKLSWVSPDASPTVSVSVSFPKDSSEFKVEEVMNAAVESGLGLTDEHNMAVFERPKLKTPKALRKVRLAQEKVNEQSDQE